MKKHIMKTTGHRVVRMLVAGIGIFAVLSSCLTDRDLDTHSPSGEETLVKFSINLPGNASATRGLSETDENTVNTIDVLVFGQGGGTYMYTAKSSGGITTNPGNSLKKSFTATLRQGDCDIVLLANARDILLTQSLKGKTKSAALAALTATMPAGGKWLTDTGDTGYRHIPMWGDVGDITIVKGSEITDSDDVRLTRMMARVDVKVTASNFVLTSIDVYNYNTLGALVPESTGWNGSTFKASVPNVPSASTLTLGPVTYGSSAIDGTGKLSEKEVYIFEAENHTGDLPLHSTAKDNDDRTCLVVGGRYGSDTEPTYYRMDFSTGTGNSEAFLDVLRNHHYTFDITSVSSAGFGSSIDAFYGRKKIEFTVDVVNWGESWDIPLPWTVRGKSNCYMVDGNSTPFVIPAGAQIADAVGTSTNPQAADMKLPSTWMDNKDRLKAAVLWSDVSPVTGDAAVVSKVKYVVRDNLEDCLIIVYPGTGTGNAVIMLYEDNDGTDGYRYHVSNNDPTDKIVWSWHIWNAGRYYPYDSAGNPTDAWMDRNIGATSNNFTNATDNVSSHGFFYQWGRKDPLPSAGETYILENTTTGNSPVHFGPDVSDVVFRTAMHASGNNLPAATQNPLMHYSHLQSVDWYTNTSTSAHYALWGAYGTGTTATYRGKSVYDPCPEGYHVPAKGAWGADTTWPVSTYGLSNTAYGGYYPLVGFRDPTYHNLDYVGSRAAYWSATMNGTLYSYFIGMLDTGTVMPDNTRRRAGGLAVRCMRDSASGAITPTLSTDSDDRRIYTDGLTYDINVTSNTEWEAVIKRGTNAVTIGDSDILGEPLIDLFNGDSPSAYVSGGTYGTSTITTITVRTVDYYTPEKYGEGEITIVFRDKSSGELLHETTITVWQGIAWHFGRSNIIMYMDGDGNKVLTFAETADDNTIGKTVSYIKSDDTQVTVDVPAMAANVQGLHFRWGGLVGVAGNGGHETVWSSNAVVFVPEEYPTANIPTTWAHSHAYGGSQVPSASPTDIVANASNDRSLDAFLTFNDGKGYKAEDGKGDVCRYITDKGWVEGNWRLPTQSDYQELYAESYNKFGVVYGISQTHSIADTGKDGKYGYYPMLYSRMLGAGVKSTDYTDHPGYMTSPEGARMLLPASGNRVYNGGRFQHPSGYGNYWSSTPSTTAGNAFYFGISNGVINPAYDSYRNYGFPVRCILDTKKK